MEYKQLLQKGLLCAEVLLTTAVAIFILLSNAGWLLLMGAIVLFPFTIFHTVACLRAACSNLPVIQLRMSLYGFVLFSLVRFDMGDSISSCQIGLSAAISYLFFRGGGLDFSIPESVGMSILVPISVAILVAVCVRDMKNLGNILTAKDKP